MNDQPHDSEQRLLIYLVTVVFAVIGTVLIASALLFLFTGCWPLERVGISNCLARTLPGYAMFSPILIGLIVGVFIARYMETH